MVLCSLRSSLAARRLLLLLPLPAPAPAPASLSEDESSESESESDASDSESDALQSEDLPKTLGCFGRSIKEQHIKKY
jgi:hypothetical protein